MLVIGAERETLDPELDLVVAPVVVAEPEGRHVPARVAGSEHAPGHVPHIRLEPKVRDRRRAVLEGLADRRTGALRALRTGRRREAERDQKRQCAST